MDHLGDHAPAPLPDAARPARSRIPPTTGAVIGVEVVVVSGQRLFAVLAYQRSWCANPHLVGVAVDRAQQRIDVDEHPLLRASKHRGLSREGD